MSSFQYWVDTIGLVLDGLGVFVIVLGVLFACVRWLASWRHANEPYRRFRTDLGRGILLGLELLVAADIIRTVAVSPTLQNVAVLGLIVLIRTFLSMALEVELEGRWPWRREKPPAN